MLKWITFLTIGLTVFLFAGPVFMSSNMHEARIVWKANGATEKNVILKSGESATLPFANVPDFSVRFPKGLLSSSTLRVYLLGNSILRVSEGHGVDAFACDVKDRRADISVLPNSLSNDSDPAGHKIMTVLLDGSNLKFTFFAYSDIREQTGTLAFVGLAASVLMLGLTYWPRGRDEFVPAPAMSVPTQPAAEAQTLVADTQTESAIETLEVRKPDVPLSNIPGDFMRRSPAIPSGMSALTAVVVMRDKKIDSLLLIKGNRPAGVITMREVLRTCLTGVKLAEIKAQELAVPIVSIGQDKTLGEACALMLRQRLGHLAVIDAVGRPMWGLTPRQAADILSHFIWEEWEDIPADRVMRRRIATVKYEHTVMEAMHMMTALETSAVVVTDNNLPAGIFTHADLLKLAAAGGDYASTPVETVAARPVLTAHVTSGLKHAVRLMHTQGFRHLVLVDDFDRAVGLLSPEDLVRMLI